MLHQDRRDWMRSSLLWSAAALLAGRSALGRAEEPKTITAIDAHTHFYDPNRPDGIPWPSKNDKLLYRGVLPEDFLKVARSLVVVGTIVVEASPRVEAPCSPFPPAYSAFSIATCGWLRFRNVTNAAGPSMFTPCELRSARS
jgi:hypothetical protein